VDATVESGIESVRDGDEVVVLEGGYCKPITLKTGKVYIACLGCLKYVSNYV
jgi:hypothetical protein